MAIRKKRTPLYHRLVVIAKPKTAIWLVDDCWHLVQKEVGTLDTSVLPGRYFIELGKPRLKGIAYPIDLSGDLHLTQVELEVRATCPRQAPKLLDSAAKPSPE